MYLKAVVSTEKLSTGKHSIKSVFKYDGGGLGKGGTITHNIDDKKTGEERIESTPPYVYSLDGMDCGMDEFSTVSDAYQKGEANHFNGVIDKVEINHLD
ncbi:hypothetical protein [Flavobacterium johnsoniae]|uniref:Uncharacterized protein n=1 Tax=Flavobacterium johnsoniae (strain ATCC 17061 / DSM 2064 / JCM 8514 / BCRC 14874 / CCUG 350202 / NBRC 14942 / NCIMB 11054 / UW101) TaxID=376686 RepID=A5FDW8_FLAJ1|nr:hypothetical protein [Flavobacterium johnsoniae]ABQ06599.1 hypothetical protein Fjoh_3585 [Flavobacterium johnsoniae UW101]OXE99835.1 hypothetical protein B0A63_11070 [Flavobacterium johnsoniae UW101]WQG82350.1 hypothetical protein SR927_04365 [Flavobacterium johnsoniae UW101]SHK80855.1 hypothetical protein SAMN05444146_2338 [Flavobacterium johnsoniae]